MGSESAFLTTTREVTEIKLVASLATTHPVSYPSSLFKNADHNPINGLHSSLVGVGRHLWVPGRMCCLLRLRAPMPTGSSPIHQHPLPAPLPHFTFLQPHRARNRKTPFLSCT